MVSGIKSTPMTSRFYFNPRFVPWPRNNMQTTSEIRRWCQECGLSGPIDQNCMHCGAGYREAAEELLAAFKTRSKRVSSRPVRPVVQHSLVYHVFSGAAKGVLGVVLFFIFMYVMLHYVM